MKAKKIIIGIISAVLIAGITFFTICLVNYIVYRNTEKPWDINNVIWYSENPEIELKQDSNGNFGYITIEGNKTEVRFIWGPTYYLQLCPHDMPLSSDNVIIGGNFSYDGKQITLKVEEDNVFNYQYKTITLYRRAIEE